MSIMSPSTNETSSIVSVWSCPVVPTPALPPNPSLIWQFLPGLGNMPPGTFFPRVPTFVLIASVPCGATFHTLPETSSQVIPAAHRWISSGPDYCSTPHERWKEWGYLCLWLASQNKRRGIVRFLLSKNFPRVTVSKWTQGKGREYSPGSQVRASKKNGWFK